MRDRTILDISDALHNNLDTIFNNKLEIGPADNPKTSLITLADWVKQKICADADTITLFDSSMQSDGAFVSFCKENNYKINDILTEAVSVLSYSEKNFDPFVLHGLYLINVEEDFSIIKSSLLFKTQQDNDGVSSFVLVAKKNYGKYLEFKESFLKWLRKREGTVIKVVGGEDYLQNIDYTWDGLFFGEKKELKDDLKKTIEQFFESKQYYYENNVPWNMSIIVEGATGSGKTSLINTIISEYDLEPITVNYFNTDDSIVNLLFKSTEIRHKNLVFIDDIDLYIEQDFVAQEYLYEQLESYMSNDGNIVIFTCKKIPDFFKGLLYTFDKIVSIGNPEYEASLTNLFGKHLTEQSLKDMKKICTSSSLSYGYLYKLYKIFVKTKLFNKPSLIKKNTKKKEVEYDLNSLIDGIVKEEEKVIKSKTKKIGLLNKQ